MRPRRAPKNPLAVAAMTGAEVAATAVVLGVVETAVGAAAVYAVYRVLQRRRTRRGAKPAR